MCVCVCVCEWRKWDVHGAGLDHSDVRPSYFNLFTAVEPRTPRRIFENFGSGHWLESSKRNRGAAVEAHILGSSSWSGRNRGVAAEVDAIGSSSWSGCKRRAADEAGVIGEQQLEAEPKGEQQLKRMPQSGPGAAAEARTQAASSS